MPPGQKSPVGHDATGAFFVLAHVFLTKNFSSNHHGHAMKTFDKNINAIFAGQHEEADCLVSDCNAALFLPMVVLPAQLNVSSSTVENNGEIP